MADHLYDNSDNNSYDNYEYYNQRCCVCVNGAKVNKIFSMEPRIAYMRSTCWAVIVKLTYLVNSQPTYVACTHE